MHCFEGICFARDKERKALEERVVALEQELAAAKQGHSSCPSEAPPEDALASTIASISTAIGLADEPDSGRVNSGRGASGGEPDNIARVDMKLIEDEISNLEQIITKIRPAQEAALAAQAQAEAQAEQENASLSPPPSATELQECHSGFHHMDPYAGMMMRHSGPSRQSSPQ
mmetsp:Transcript_57334/g.134413  ORF Transcript_57334/g.134413 Transcript_57334/m.134413 type:complete len:172 (+) Transcript_57334:79-594(+)